MIPRTRRLILVESAHLKLSATSRLAEGGTDAAFEASVLFHAAARAERRALEATETPTFTDRLRSAVEVCGCLIDGLDPSAVLEWGWRRVLEASDGLQDSEAMAIRGRLDPRFGSFVRSYQRVLKHAPESAAAMAMGKLPQNEGELAVLLDAFPGDSRLWASLAAIRAKRGATKLAWGSIQRARKLAPDDTCIRSAELSLVVEAQADQAPAMLIDAYSEVFEGGNADLSFGFITAATQLGLRSKGREWLERAAEVSVVGMGQAPLHPLDRARFRAFRLILGELLAGRKPGLEILYRTGLGEWVISSTKKDPLEILLARGALVRAA